jgi:hypothetical protein
MDELSERPASHAAAADLACFASHQPPLLPASGGGLWRVYVRKRDHGSFEAVHHRLIGIASREDKGSPPRITCQGGPG